MNTNMLVALAAASVFVASFVLGTRVDGSHTVTRQAAADARPQHARGAVPGLALQAAVPLPAAGRLAPPPPPAPPRPRRAPRRAAPAPAPTPVTSPAPPAPRPVTPRPAPIAPAPKPSPPARPAPAPKPKPERPVPFDSQG